MIQFKHIKKCGVELEGAFDRTVVDTEPQGVSAGRESSGIKLESMRLTDAENAIVREQNLIVGERNSLPYDNLALLRKWINKFFPKLTNYSNGFHVHVSFKDDNHRRKIIASKEFHGAFLKAAAEFVKTNKYKFNQDVLARVVEGRNDFARHDYNPEARYAVHALSHWGTCEFRLFSGSINCKQAKIILTWLVSFVEEYIDDVIMAEANKDLGVGYEPLATVTKQNYTGQPIGELGGNGPTISVVGTVT